MAVDGVKEFRVTEPYLRLDCELGEAPYWERNTNTLRFVDIHKEVIHTVNLDEGPSSHRVIAQPEIAISTTANVVGNDNLIAFGGKQGYGLFNRTDHTSTYIRKVWNDDEMDKGYNHRLRGNDGAVDSHGRFWLGMMNDPRTNPDFKDEGVLFRLDPDGTLHRMLEKVTIPNGISWSLDDKLMYFTDTPTKTVDIFDYEADSGTISNRRQFYRYEGEDGAPDGHCQDNDGNLWICICGGGQVVKVSPQGKLLAKVLLPTAMPTCPVLCGDTLYITSAAEQHPKEGNVSGSIFACHVGDGAKGLLGRQPNDFKWHV